MLLQHAKLKQQIELQFIIFYVYYSYNLVPREDFIDVLEISHAHSLYIDKKNKMNKNIIFEMMDG